MWLKIKVLSWKSLKLQRKYWFCTVIEIIVPCLLFFYMKYMRLNRPEKGLSNNITIPNPVSEQFLYNEFMDKFPSEYYIYTPKTAETKEIMKRVAKNFNITFDNIDTANSEVEMNQKIIDKINLPEGRSLIGFGIVFEEIIKSNVFKYKIKSTHDICDTNLLFPEYDIPGPMDSGKDYFRLGFLALQLMLDKTFINLDMFDTTTTRTNTTDITDYNLEIQSYPYAKFIQDPLQTQFQLLFPMVTVLSFLFMYLRTIKSIVEEKESGIRELMKIMGLKSWMICTGWLLHNVYTYTLSIIIITYISCFEVFSGAGKLLYYTNPLLFWTFLMLFMISGVFFCFAISSAFDRPLVALLVGISLWIFSFVLPYHFFKPATNNLIKIICMLLPNVAVTIGFTSISSLESSGVGLQFSTLFTSGKGLNNFSVGFVLFMFILDCFLYGFITWYLNSIMLGDNGFTKLLLFLFKCSTNKFEKNDMFPVSIGNKKLFEKPQSGFEVGVSIKNLHKKFGNFNALNGVNLDLYKGQITVLLGHNGAGKTTTMSIITGLFSPSSGNVEINGNNLFSNIDKFRKNLGLCPQHNLLFSYLTTLDHLIFFGMLKGKSLEQSKLDGLHLLELLNLQNIKNEYTSNLSGGMKRKVSLAIALVGHPEILILDEPTSGMDPESRRQMWDLILSFRGTRTILITTHFMEEADVLGDRIAIMDHGQIKCYGTSLFLKKVYGTGYNLTILKEEMCNETKIIEEIKTIIPEAKIQSSLSAKLLINLRNKNTDGFSNLFRMLENNKTELGINGITISCTTMEEVFLSSAVAKNIEDEPSQQRNNNFTEVLMPMYIKGNNLLKNQLKVLLEKKVTYTCRRWFMSLVFGLGSIILSILVMTSTYAAFGNSEVSQALNLSLSTYKDIRVYYRAGDVTSENLEPRFVDISIKHQATVIEASPKNNMINDLLEMCNQDVLTYRYNLMIAGDFNQNNSTIMYNNVAIHTPAIAINLYTNALLQQVTGKQSSYISTVNERILENTVNACSINFVIHLTFLWLTIFTPGLLFVIGYFIALPLTERVSGIKHLQMMTKLSPITYWIACFLWDYFCYITIVIFSLTTMYLIDTYHIFTGPNEIVTLLVLMLIYGWSSIFYAYMYSFYNKTLVSSMLLFISINFISGLFINNIIFFMRDTIKIRNKITPFNFWNIFRYITLIIPHFSYSSCLLGFLEISWGNNRCKVCNTSQECHDSSDYKPKSYFVFASDENEFGILEETLFLLFSSILYITIVLLFDYKVLSHVYEISLNKIIGLGDSYKNNSEDSDVDDEKDKVDAAKTKTSNDSSSPILLVDNLVKKFSFKFTGVRGISFAVSPGECFGLLGVNGAGKTTIFRILTGDAFPSRGDAYVQTDKLYKLSSNINQYASMIGYCPQFDAINDYLTGRETLKLMAILRGIAPLKTKNHVNKWIKLLDLEEYKDKICGEYSKGNKRKLNTAMALIGDPPIVFLDEPTSGVDPVARRNLWKLLAFSQSGGQAVVLSSHSMDECEALCNRLTIMVDGVMKCIGDIQYLKSRYGQGFTIIVKLFNCENTNIDELKLYIEQQFSPSIFLKDEHKGMLHYHITNPHLPLSDIFGFMKATKDKYLIIEDYTVGDTTLEDVFIAFAKKQAILKTKS